ncbi:DNA ligase [Plasmodiophora brassicae]
MTTPVEQIAWADLCGLFERVERAQGSLDKQHAFEEWFGAHPAMGTADCYPVMRLVVPKFDKDRTYGINIKKIAELYIKTNVWPDSKARRLIHFSNAKVVHKKETVGNFTSVLGQLLREEGLTTPSKRTLGDTNGLLDALAHSENRAEREKLWYSMQVEVPSAIEHKWLMRVVLKDMKLGIGENTILRVFHKDAVEWYNITSDLKTVCSNAIHPEISGTGSGSTEISLSFAVRPMLAARVEWADIVGVVQDSPPGDWSVELKFDGERCLVYKNGAEFRMFSRNQLELSVKYPDYLRSMLPYFRDRIVARSCIIDGELLAWDNDRNGYMPFGSNRPVASGSIPNATLCYVAFDIILLDDKPLNSLPLRKRRAILSDVIPNPVPHRLEVSWNREVQKPDDIMAALDLAVEQNNEGLVLKNLSTTYETNLRDKRYWMKVKADYILGDSLCDTMDAVLVGAWHGKRHGGGLASFLFAIANERNLDADGHPKTFYTLTKVGSGYSQDDLALIMEHIEPHLETFNRDSVPSWLEQPLPSRFENPEVVIDPKKSIVVEIKGFELRPSNRFSCGYTVRFPTIVRLRLDKNWFDVHTIADLRQMVSGPQGGRLFHSVRLHVGEDGHGVRKKAKRSHPEPIQVISSLPSSQLNVIEAKSSLFAGLTFHVRSCTSEMTTQDMLKLLKANGGNIQMNLTQDSASRVTYVVAGDKTVQVANLIRQMTCEEPQLDVDVVTFQWVIDSIAANQLQFLLPRYYYHLSQTTREKLSSLMDVETGVVWGHVPDAGECKQIYETVRELHPRDVRPPMGLKRLRSVVGDCLYELLFTPMTMFRDLSVVSVNQCSKPDVHGSPCWKVRSIIALLRVYSATVADSVTSDTSHILVCSCNDLTNPSVLKAMNTMLSTTSRHQRESLHVSTRQWVLECCERMPLGTKSHIFDEDSQEVFRVPDVLSPRR